MLPVCPLGRPLSCCGCELQIDTRLCRKRYPFSISPPVLHQSWLFERQEAHSWVIGRAVVSLFSGGCRGYPAVYVCLSVARASRSQNAPSRPGDRSRTYSTRLFEGVDGHSGVRPSATRQPAIRGAAHTACSGLQLKVSTGRLISPCLPQH